MADARIADALVRLPDYFGNHVLVSVTALALGLTILPSLLCRTGTAIEYAGECAYTRPIRS